MFSPGRTQPIFLVAASGPKYSKGLMMMMMMMMMMILMMTVLMVVMMIMMMLLFVLMIMMMMMMMMMTFQALFEVFLMSCFVCLGFLKRILTPDIFIHNILKLRRHLSIKTCGRLP